MRLPLFILSILFASCLNGQSIYVPLSPVQELSQIVGLTKVKLTYSRPATRGRKIFGDLVPYGAKWRTGANRNTKIQFSESVAIKGMDIAKGTYAIITEPSETNWDVYLYADTTHWEVPSPWHDSPNSSRDEV